MDAHRPAAKLLTKGDNNLGDDTELYARGQDYLVRKDIVGSVVGCVDSALFLGVSLSSTDFFFLFFFLSYIPWVGYVTIALSEHPWLKTVMLGGMGLFAILQRE